ncbi:MAG: PHP domain-containing protein [Desulfobacteraceae bacterium]|nr:MAG: PHP domain-containing protein [Desulfobacteraceae bacterium]
MMLRNYRIFEAFSYRFSKSFFSHKAKIWVLLLAVAVHLQTSGAVAEEFIQLPGVIHVHSSFSSGDHTFKELVDMAQEKSLEVLIPTDHDMVAMEYGIFPLRNILKKRVEMKSVLQAGAQKYLEEIEAINKEQNRVLIVPGVQTSPFYYWTGSPFQGDLTAHDYQKELLLIGMTNPADYLNLPLLHRGFSKTYVKNYLTRFLILLFALLSGLYLAFQKGTYRYFGFAICAASLILLVNHHPFQSSRFDPNYGNQGIQPYQDLIDYVGARKGLVFWSHPEALAAAGGVKMGLVTLQTEPYPDALVQSKNYTGFAGLYGELTKVNEPGRQWDQVLLEYCEEKRPQPVWAIAEADFHKPKNEGGAVDIDSYQTVFLVRSKGTQAVLDALSSGKIYAVRKGTNARLILNRFQVGSKGYKVLANMGEKLNSVSQPEIHIGVSASDHGEHPVKLTLVRRGKVFKEIEAKTPVEITIQDEEGWEGISYYRLEVDGKTEGEILSNPIFVSREQ